MSKAKEHGVYESILLVNSIFNKNNSRNNNTKAKDVQSQNRNVYSRHLYHLDVDLIFSILLYTIFKPATTAAEDSNRKSNLRQPNFQRHLSTSVDDRCVDRSSVDGGICNEELGYGVVDGVCEFIVGCGDMEDYFYDMSGCNWVCIRCDGAIGAEWNDDC